MLLLVYTFNKYLVLLQVIFLFKYFLKRFKKGSREGNISVSLPLTCPLLGTWPTTQARALIGNGTGDPLVHELALNPLSHTSQG